MWWIFMSWSADFGCNQQVNQTTPLRWPCYRLVTKAAVTRVLTQSVSLLFLWLFFQQILMRKFEKKRGRVPDVADVFVVCNEWLRYAQPPCTGNGLGESKFPHVSTFKKKKKKKKFTKKEKKKERKIIMYRRVKLPLILLWLLTRGFLFFFHLVKIF